MKFESIVLNAERNVHLSCFLHDCDCTYIPAKERPAVIVLPGGAYQFLSDRESEPVARAFLNAGFHAFVLYYSVGKHALWPAPLTDFEQAMDTILARADEWHVCADRIAAVGFSAGGHLAASAATVARIRPAAVMLGYPVIKDYIAAICTPGLPLPSEHVDEKTPPCFLFACRDDKLVDVSNFLNFQAALARCGISFESHIYALGGHGFSTGAEEFQEQTLCSRVGRWTADAIAWLGDLWGKMTPEGFSSPIVSHFTNADRSGALSLDCTIAFLRAQKAAEPLLRRLFGVLDGMLSRLSLPAASAAEFEAAYTMRFLAAISGMSEDALLALEKDLNRITPVLDGDASASEV